MKRLLTLLLCLAAFLPLLASCQVPNTGDTNETTTQNQNQTPPGGSSEDDKNNGTDGGNDDALVEKEVYGYWFSDAANVAMEIIKESNAVKFYSLSAGYYEYYKIDDATYLYNKEEEKLTLRLDEKDYDFVFDPYEDSLTLNTTVYVRKNEPPKEHPSYQFPSYAEMNLSGILTLPDYKAMDIREIALAEARMNIFQEHHTSGFSTAVEITDRPAQFGDLVEVDFVGKINGETFEGGSSDQGPQQVKILYNSNFIPGFAEGIIGYNIGDTFDVALTFPDDYYEEFAGKDVVFEITLHKIYDVRLTDKQFASYTALPYETYDEWVEAEAGELAGELMLTMLYEEAEIHGELPEETYIYFYQSLLDQAHYTAEYYGMTYEQFCQLYGDPTEKILTQSKSYAINYIIPHAIFAAEELNWTDAEYNTVFAKFVNELVQKYGYSQEDATLYVTNNQPGEVKAEVVITVVIDYLATVAMNPINS